MAHLDLRMRTTSLTSYLLTCPLAPDAPALRDQLPSVHREHLGDRMPAKWAPVRRQVQVHVTTVVRPDNVVATHWKHALALRARFQESR